MLQMNAKGLMMMMVTRSIVTEKQERLQRGPYNALQPLLLCVFARNIRSFNHRNATFTHIQVGDNVRSSLEFKSTREDNYNSAVYILSVGLAGSYDILTLFRRPSF